MNGIQFHSAEEMLSRIQTEDLYNLVTGEYVFLYSDTGAIAVYHLSLNQAKELEKQSRENAGEYWGAFLGRGGVIFDEPRYCTSDKTSNIRYCEESFQMGVWVNTHDVLNERKCA